MGTIRSTWLHDTTEVITDTERAAQQSDDDWFEAHWGDVDPKWTDTATEPTGGTGASFETRWQHDSEQVGVITTRDEGESKADWAERHKVRVAAKKATHPPD